LHSILRDEHSNISLCGIWFSSFILFPLCPIIWAVLCLLVFSEFSGLYTACFIKMF
jgi:hypothetical protein